MFIKPVQNPVVFRTGVVPPQQPKPIDNCTPLTPPVEEKTPGIMYGRVRIIEPAKDCQLNCLV